MPKTRTSQKRNDEPRTIRVLRCVQLRDDGYPLDDERVVLRITAEMTEREFKRVSDAWESGEDYAIDVAGKAHVGMVKGNVMITENGPDKWIVLFELHEDPEDGSRS